MPTPTEVFAELAARHGGVDANDARAVARWYTEDVPRLPRETIESLLEELLRREGEARVGMVRRNYPPGNRIPALGVSPPAPLPLLAIGMRGIFRRMLRGLGRKPRPR